MAEVLREYADEHEWLSHKYPWFGILVNWFVVGLLLTILVATIAYGIQNNTERKAAEMTATAMAELEAQRQAQAEAQAEALAAERASEDYIMTQEATEMAKAFYGIRLFVEKYNYTEKDFETYARCMFNRADAGAGRLVEVITREGQFLGYYEKNPVLDEYFQMAIKFVKEWHSESTKPVDSSYQYAELNPDGIWLKNDINANGYARRWRA